MPYTIGWHIPDRVVLITFEGTMTLDDIDHMNLDTMALVGQGVPPIHVVSDLLAMERYPTSIQEISKFIRNDMKARLGWTIVITRNKLVRFMSAIIIQLTGARLRFFDTLDDALIFLHDNDVTLSRPSEQATQT
jgi:hypothetical protein